MRVRFIVIALVTLCFAANVSALPTRLIRFDQGDGYLDFGTIWEDVPPVLNPTAAIEISLLAFPIFPDNADINFPDTSDGIRINYGSTPTPDKLFIHPEGYISFGTSLSPGVDTSTGDLLDNVAAPFYVKDGVTTSSISYAKGLIDGSTDGSPHSIDNALNALRITWKIAQVDSNIPDFAFQLVLLDRSDLAVGDFDMEFNYQDLGLAEAPPGALRTAGFQLGANSVGPTPSFTQDDSRVFQFRGGIGSIYVPSTPPTNVPEPNSLPLFLTGLLLLATGMYRRRMVRQPAR